MAPLFLLHRPTTLWRTRPCRLLAGPSAHGITLPVFAPSPLRRPTTLSMGPRLERRTRTCRLLAGPSVHALTLPILTPSLLRRPTTSRRIRRCWRRQRRRRAPPPPASDTSRSPSSWRVGAASPSCRACAAAMVGIGMGRVGAVHCCGAAVAQRALQRSNSLAASPPFLCAATEECLHKPASI